VLSVAIAQEHTQRATQRDDRVLAQAPTRVGHERAEDGRGQLFEFANLDACKIRLEGSEVMPVVANGRLPQTSFLAQVGKESGRFDQERIADDAGAPPGDERWHQLRDELFYRSSNLIGELPVARRTAPTIAFRNPLSHERLDVLGKLFPLPRATPPAELRELPEHRYPGTDIAHGIAVVRQPRDVLLDGFTEPAVANPIDGVGLGEIVLQHDNLLSG